MNNVQLLGKTQSKVTMGEYLHAYVIKDYSRSLIQLDASNYTHMQTQCNQCRQYVVY